MQRIKAIDTRYKGYRFRSRLEARWAVFFDAMGCRWDYELEGFVLSNGIHYLPDFYLPEYELFVEIKGGKPTADEKTKCHILAQDTNKEVWLLNGGVGTIEEWGAIINGDVFLPYQSIFDYNKKFCANGSGLLQFLTNSTFDWLKESKLLPDDCRKNASAIQKMIDADRKYYFDKYNKSHPKYELGFIYAEDVEIMSCGSGNDYLLMRSITAARSERFEHCERT